MAAKKVVTRDSVVSKTARASRGQAKVKYIHPCFVCQAPAVATKCYNERGGNRGMYWICNDDHREKIRRK